MHVRFRVLKGSNAGKEIPIPTPKCLIGRGEDCHLRPNIDAVSRHHCLILTTENEVMVKDLNSRNGTFVNGEKVAGEAVLLAEDVLRIGPVEFEVLLEQSQSKAKRPKVADIREAVARTAESSIGGATKELDDIGAWLEEADTDHKQRRSTEPDTRQFRIDDTSSSSGATKVDAAHDTKALVPDKKDKKGPGKLPPRPTTSKENSREAAADMLKKFFNRR